MKNNKKKNGPKKPRSRTGLTAPGRAKKRPNADRPVIDARIASQAIIAAIGDGITIQSTDFRILYQNPVHKQMIGEHTGEYCYRTFHQRDAVCDECPLEKSFRDGKVHTAERSSESDRGTVHVEITTSPLRDPSGTIVAGIEVVRDKTESKRREAAVRESEELFRGAFENANVGVSIVDLNGRFQKVNKRLCEMLGYSESELLTKTFSDVTHPDDVQRGKDALSKQREGKADVLSFEKRYLHRDGHVVTAIISPSVVRDATGKPVRCVGLWQDITERKRAEEALKRSRDLLAKAEEIARLGSWEWDIATNRLEWSDEVYRLYGIAKGKDAPSYDVVLNTLHPDFRERFTMDIESALMRGQPLDGEYCLVRPDGTLRFTRSKGEVVRDNAGKPVRMVGIVQDITDQKQAELMVRNVLETVDEGFIIIDRDYRILSANRAYAQQAGRSVDEIIGKKCHEMSHGYFMPCHEFGETCAVRRVFETGEPHTALHTHHNEDKDPIYVETKAFPMRDAAGRVTAAIEIVNNITEQKKLEDQLRHAQKMEAVGLLAGGVAHDFNNILTAIIGYGNLLEMRYPEDDPHRQYVDQILAAAARAANLTQSLLAFSRKQVINPRPLDVNEIIGRVEKLLQRVIGEDVDLRTELQPGALMVMADSSQMEQVLMNLATNARDAMPGGGVLTIRTGTMMMGQEFRKVHGFGADGTYATVAVSDTGSGMDERTRARIFEPFFTTKELGRGTGLGLAIV
ncbi:MAG TPA: PAS domain S-box protein, partial [Nitrospirota bacterium]|nr:PAS domain S-box protein [Nitrospirota bacterium]